MSGSLTRVLNIIIPYMHRSDAERAELRILEQLHPMRFHKITSWHSFSEERVETTMQAIPVGLNNIRGGPTRPELDMYLKNITTILDNPALKISLTVLQYN